MGSYVTDEDRAAFSAIAEGDTAEDQLTTPEVPAAELDTPDEGEEGTGELVEPGADDQEVEQAEGDEDQESFTVKVDGQEVQVSREELVNGYQRQADYTRKSQQVAADRRRLADAELLMSKLDENPMATIQVLMQHYGVDYGEGEDGEPQITGPTPEQIQLRELQQWQAGELQRQREAAVDAELDRLHREYGDFEHEDLFGFALDHNVRDLETALRAMTFRPAADKRTEKRKVAAMSGAKVATG